MLLPSRLLALLAALFLAAAAPPEREIAVTYDDLPAADAGPDLVWAQISTSRLLAGLKRHGVPAVGFVNERGLEGLNHEARVRLLAQWLDAGMDLANHGYSHLSLTSTPLDIYEADIAKGATETRALLEARGQALRYFRHPYLHTGPTTEVREGFDAWLAANGYTVAPVTIENSDWVFATVYAAALKRGDEAEAKRVSNAYLDYTDARVGWYLKAAEGLLGRQPRHILLLHANRLNGDTVDEMVALLKKHGFRIVSLERALADPLYALPDPYIGPDGRGWLHRIAQGMGKELPWDSSPEVPADIAEAYENGPPANQWPS